MTRHAPITPIALIAVAVVAAVAWWIPVTPQAPPVGRDDPAAAGEALPPGPEGGEPREAVPAAIEDGHEGLDGSGLWDYLNDPANSDLSAEDFAEYTQLGIALFRADVTGEGRERWPDRWSSIEDSRNEPCCIDITVHAASPYTDPADPETIRATIIWSGEALNGSVLSEQLVDFALLSG